MAYRRFEGPGRNVYCVPEYPRECVQQSWQKPRATLVGKFVRTSKYPIFSPEVSGFVPSMSPEESECRQFVAEASDFVAVSRGI